MKISIPLAAVSFLGAAATPVQALDTDDYGFPVEEYAVVKSIPEFKDRPGAQISVVCDEQGRRIKAFVIHIENPTPETDPRDDLTRYVDYDRRSKAIRATNDPIFQASSLHTFFRQVQRPQTVGGYQTIESLTRHLCRPQFMSFLTRKTAALL